MHIDGGHVYVWAYVARKIRRGLRAEGSRAMGVTSVRVLQVRSDAWDVEGYRSGAWRTIEIKPLSTKVLRDKADAAAVQQWFENGVRDGGELQACHTGATSDNEVGG